MTLPAGADQVFVDAYVGGTWINGTAAETPSTLALPGTVTAGDVEGLRFTFKSSTGTATLTAGGAAGSEVLNLVQRSVFRGTTTSIVHGGTATNVAEATVSVPGQTAVTKTATATYVITPLNSVVNATKSFSPSTIAAGSSSVALVTATNASNGPLKSMTVTEPTGGAFFTPLVAFGGFTAASTFPTGATNASIVWSVNTGTAPTSPDFTSATMPSTPALAGGQYITGFAITYTGSIAADATAGDSFRVNVAGDENTDSSTPVAAREPGHRRGIERCRNRDARSRVGNPDGAGTADRHHRGQDGHPVGRNRYRWTQHRAALHRGCRNHRPRAADHHHREGCRDRHALDYWNAFNAVGVAPTQVPLGSKLQVSYTTDGTTWVALPVQDATTAALWYSAVLPTSASIVGLEFVFTNPNGFSLSSTVKPAISFEARSTLRSGGPTATVGTPVTYTNSVLAEGDAVVQTSTGPEAISGTATDSAPGTIKALPGGDDGTLLVKAWQKPSGSASTDVPTQSSQTRNARISWGTQVDGTTSATITDSANATNAFQSTVYQAFNLSQDQRHHPGDRPAHRVRPDHERPAAQPERPLVRRVDHCRLQVHRAGDQPVRRNLPRLHADGCPDGHHRRCSHRHHAR